MSECKHFDYTVECICLDCRFEIPDDLHNEAIRKQERKRIIKLLTEDCKNGIGDNLQGCFHEVAIALIKEKQK